VDIARGVNTFQDGAASLGEPSEYTCPECHGTLNKIKEGPMVRFRCHAGHAYSLDVLLSSVTLSVQDAMWNTIRVLEESALVLQQMGRQLEVLGTADQAQIYYQKAQQAAEHAQKVRELVLATEVLSEEMLSQQKPDEPLAREGSQ
jgi:two-component system chemotaxis response regulator CheB